MTDTVQLGKSKEEVAYLLMWDILRAENHKELSRELLLRTYWEAHRVCVGAKPG